MNKDKNIRIKKLKKLLQKVPNPTKILHEFEFNDEEFIYYILAYYIGPEQANKFIHDNLDDKSYEIASELLNISIHDEEKTREFITHLVDNCIEEYTYRFKNDPYAIISVIETYFSNFITFYDNFMIYLKKYEDDDDDDESSDDENKDENITRILVNI